MSRALDASSPATSIPEIRAATMPVGRQGGRPDSVVATNHHFEKNAKGAMI